MKTSMRAAWVALGLVSCGCGSSPSTTYYTLAAVSGTLRQTHAERRGAVEVRRPGIAGYLDRSEILAQWNGQRLQLANNACWGEPIASMIGRVLAEDLSARLRDTIAFSATSDLSVPADTVLELVVRKFDLGSDGYVHLDVIWAVRGASAGAGQSVRTVALKARPVSTETSAIVAAMSSLLGQLADEVADAMTASGMQGTTASSPALGSW